jgi:hypothetical protein
MPTLICGGTRCRSWLRHCATSRKVEGSIPDVVIEIFHWHNHSGCTTALISTRPLTEMSTRNMPMSVVSKSWNPQGLPRLLMWLLYLYLNMWMLTVWALISLCLSTWTTSDITSRQFGSCKMRNSQFLLYRNLQQSPLTALLTTVRMTLDALSSLVYVWIQTTNIVMLRVTEQRVTAVRWPAYGTVQPTDSHSTSAQFASSCACCPEYSYYAVSYYCLLGVLHEVRRRKSYLEITLLCDLIGANKPFVGFS